MDFAELRDARRSMLRVVGRHPRLAESALAGPAGQAPLAPKPPTTFAVVTAAGDRSGDAPRVPRALTAGVLPVVDVRAAATPRYATVAARLLAAQGRGGLVEVPTRVTGRCAAATPALPTVSRFPRAPRCP